MEVGASHDNAISVENVSVSFFTKAGEIRAIRDISYSIPKGKVLGVVGESGCGKSVTSLTVMRLLQSPGVLKSGKIFINGTDTTHFNDNEMNKVRGRQAAMIFQEPMTALNPVQKIYKQISEPLIYHEGMNKKEALDRSIEMLKLVGIPSPEKRAKAYPHELSGGMRQRAMIAIALACDPNVLIADEPTTALDVTIQAQILELMLEMQEKRGMAVQFISHDLGVISELSDEIIVMYAGRIVERGPAQHVLSHPKHPYTVGLMESIPNPNKKSRRLYTIPGQVPNLLHLPKGCPFANRCEYAQDDCRQQDPDLEQVDALHAVACFHPVGQSAGHPAATQPKLNDHSDLHPNA